MAALTADRVTRKKNTTPGASCRTQRYAMAASTTIFKGGMVCLNAAGLAVPASDTSGLSAVVGVAAHSQTSGASGTSYILVEYGCAFLLPCTGAITQADVGRDACVADDQTLSDAAAMTNDILVGRVLALGDVAGTAWVNITNTPV